DVLVGNMFLMKLHHTSEHKEQGRGTRGSYSSLDEPAKGGSSGSKRLSLLDVNALLSHGALSTIRDAMLVRGQKNERYWLEFLQGHSPQVSEPPLRYQKFLSDLEASGIHVRRNGGQLQIMALTDQDVKTLAGDREVRNGELIQWNRGRKA